MSAPIWCKCTKLVQRLDRDGTPPALQDPERATAPFPRTEAFPGQAIAGPLRRRARVAESAICSKVWPDGDLLAGFAAMSRVRRSSGYFDLDASRRHGSPVRQLRPRLCRSSSRGGRTPFALSRLRCRRRRPRVRLPACPDPEGDHPTGWLFRLTKSAFVIAARFVADVCRWYWGPSLVALAVKP